MKYVSIDTETTGLDENTCQIIEIGIVTDDLSQDDFQAEIFHAYIVEDAYAGDPYALSMHSTIFRKIALRTPPYQYLRSTDAVIAIDQFFRKHFKGPVTVAGKNYAMFDNRFLSKKPGWRDLDISHRVLDVGTLYFDPTVDKAIPNTEECMKRAGLAGVVPHNAVDDAKLVIQLIRNRFAKRSVDV